MDSEGKTSLHKAKQEIIFKPDKVRIVPPLSVMGLPQQSAMGVGGQLQLLIIAMGDDNVVYRWNGPDQVWEAQQ